MREHDHDELDVLRGRPMPQPSHAARERALRTALVAFDEKSSPAAQGTGAVGRLMEQTVAWWRGLMEKRLIAAPALASLIALPVAGYVAFEVMENWSPAGRTGGEAVVQQTAGPQVAKPAESQAEAAGEAERDAALDLAPAAPAPQATAELPAARQPASGGRRDRDPSAGGKLMAPQAAPAPMTAESYEPGADILAQPEENRDRFAQFDTNPVKLAAEDPVSTFSIDVDTASYSFVRRSLKEGFLPNPDAVRVEEMINYFPYDWPAPADASAPFQTSVAVMPTPWNPDTRLMHVAVQGYDVAPAVAPRANLVFLIDTSGSMDSPDKLPLLQSAFRLLVDRLGPEDMVSIVAYAGEAGVVLEPTVASDRAAILRAIDTLQPGGRTAGEAGIKEAYRLAEQGFVQDGVNRVMLATDGDFNVGQTDDRELERLIEEKRESGVFLSVFGFGRGNLNDRLMQELAQNGNGAAAYIDTLAEAEKVLVEEASATLFPIAKDVKIQVEFNPARVSEYRLIGYETRALNREDFNDDRVDAGEIGSGHSVTAIYEITPKGSPAELNDPLRYGEASVANPTGIVGGEEYAFVKLRYKLPNEDLSKLIEQPVTEAQALPSLEAASDDQRFSVAVAAFGQKLRGVNALKGFDWARIGEIAQVARGTDPFGYRSEFLSLVRLAASLDETRR
ncbi:MAG TPA: VWA domain-containing protein [Mesorhizobium sp.]|jgi:Ca-activated chloride channel family protein|nr:VWA domain-containing protein [Mesorhizobium sp.]